MPQILGLNFFDGSVSAAVDHALEKRGLIVAPSGTCFRRLQRDAVYRAAMTNADLVLPDSGLMVLLWRLLRGASVNGASGTSDMDGKAARVAGSEAGAERINRISGLAYLNELLGRAEFRTEGAVLWILPDSYAREVALGWLQSHGFPTTADDCYIAPFYGAHVEDPVLVERLRSRPAHHVVIALSGGVQEKLGFHLREQSRNRAAIHCIGAALGFITGYQVAIPHWADRLYLGWLFRLITNPRRFLPRALSAFALPRLIMKYGERLPPEKS